MTTLFLNHLFSWISLIGTAGKDTSPPERPTATRRTSVGVNLTFLNSWADLLELIICAMTETKFSLKGICEGKINSFSFWINQLTIAWSWGVKDVLTFKREVKILLKVSLLPSVNNLYLTFSNLIGFWKSTVEGSQVPFER